MASYYFSAPVQNNQALFISALSDFEIELSGEVLDDASGYFLYQRSYDSPDRPITVLARLHSEEAAFQMSQILSLA